jgi:hypothetical protein
MEAATPPITIEGIWAALSQLVRSARADLSEPGSPSGTESLPQSGPTLTDRLNLLLAVRIVPERTARGH